MKIIRNTGLLFFICMQTSFLWHRVNAVNISDLQKEIIKNNDTLYVVNFWATWCAPCVKELPSFKAVYTRYASNKVKMIYVSLNSMQELAKVEKFAEDNSLKPEVLLLNENNPNSWINKIDSGWSGTIPATGIYRNGKKIYFQEGDFTEDKLNNLIQAKLNKP